MRTCIYCKRTLPTREFSREHVWPAALGWDAQISCVCRKCNNEFGHEIDSALISCFDTYRVKFKVKDRDGKTPRPYVKVEGGLLSGSRLRYGVDGLEPPPIIKKTAISPGGMDFRTYGDHDEAELKKKLKPQGVGKLVKLSEQTEELKLVSRHGMEFLSDVRGMRGAVKIAFNYLALKTDEHLLLQPEFDPLRDFIRGNSSIDKDVLVLPMLPLPPAIPLHSTFVAHMGNGKVRAIVSMFGFIGLYIHMADGYAGRDINFATLIDPESREHKDLVPKGKRAPEWIPELEEIHDTLLKSPQHLNFHKRAVFQSAIRHINGHFKRIGDNFKIEPA